MMAAALTEPIGVFPLVFINASDRGVSMRQGEVVGEAVLEDTISPTKQEGEEAIIRRVRSDVEHNEKKETSVAD